VIRLRVLCPEDDGVVDCVLEVLAAEPGAVHIVRLRGAAVDPPGDVVEADLVRESVDEVLDALRELGCVHRGGVVLETLDTVVSDAADRAEQAAPGQGIDAVVWDELLSRTGQGAKLSVTSHCGREHRGPGRGLHLGHHRARGGLRGGRGGPRRLGPGRELAAAAGRQRRGRRARGAGRPAGRAGLAAPTRPARIPPFDAGGPVESLG
jgi:hypothetical protein